MLKLTIIAIKEAIDPQLKEQLQNKYNYIKEEYQARLFDANGNKVDSTNFIGSTTYDMRVTDCYLN